MKLRSDKRHSRLQKAFSLCTLLFVWSFMGPVWASEDDYLKSLEMESQKIRGAEKVDKEADAMEAAGDDTTSIDAQRNAFDTYMKAKHKGTYAFYRKLPEHSREEIFKAFVNGASMTEIRHMVVDRKMNR